MLTLTWYNFYKNKEEGSLIFPVFFFIVYQVAVFRTFSIVLSCSFAERTEAMHQLLLFI